MKNKIVNYIVNNVEELVPYKDNKDCRKRVWDDYRDECECADEVEMKSQFDEDFLIWYIEDKDNSIGWDWVWDENWFQ